MAGRVKKVVAWYSGPARNRRFGYTAIIAGTVLALSVAVLTAVSTKPSIVAALLIALMSAGFQIGGAVAFRNDGEDRRADDQLVQSATERLVRLGLRAQNGAVMAQAAFESERDAVSDGVTMGVLSERLDNITDGVYSALRDWRFHRAAHPAAKSVNDMDQDPALGRIRPTPFTPIPKGAEDDAD